MWGCDFMPIKPDVYPLKTYPDFFEENPRRKRRKKWLTLYLLFWKPFLP